MQTATPLKSKTVLPGLALLFLGQCYITLVYLFFSFVGTEMATGTIDEFNVEPYLWRLAIVVLSGLTIAATAGMHLRAAWTGKTARILCMAGIAVLIAILLRLVYFISADIYYSGDLEEILIFWLLGALILQIIVYHAWRRYFTNSPRLKAALGDASPTERELPPLSIALLQLMCAGILAMSLSELIGFALGERDFEIAANQIWNTANAVLACFLLIFLFKRQRGPAYIVIGLWFLLAVSALYTLTMFAEPTGYRDLGNMLMSALSGSLFTPMFILLALAALWWRLDSTEDSGWFGDTDTAKTTGADYTPPLVLAWAAYSLLPSALSYVVTYMLNNNIDLTDPFHAAQLAINTSAFIAGLGMICVSAVLFYIRSERAAMFGLITVCFCMLCHLASVGLLVWSAMLGIYSLWFSLPVLLSVLFHIFVLLLGARHFSQIRHERKEPVEKNVIAARTPLPLIAFQVFCVDMILTALWQLLPGLLAKMPEWHEADSYIVGLIEETVLSNDNLIAVIFTAALMIWAIRARKSSILYCLTAIQVFLLLSTIYTGLAGMIIMGKSGFDMNTRHVIQQLGWLIQILLVFAIYLYSSSRSKKWLGSPYPDGSAADAGPGIAGAGA